MEEDGNRYGGNGGRVSKSEIRFRISEYGGLSYSQTDLSDPAMAEFPKTMHECYKISKLIYVFALGGQ